MYAYLQLTACAYAYVGQPVISTCQTLLTKRAAECQRKFIKRASHLQNPTGPGADMEGYQKSKGVHWTAMEGTKTDQPSCPNVIESDKTEETIQSWARTGKGDPGST